MTESQTPQETTTPSTAAPKATVSRFIRKPAIKPEDHARINVGKLLPLLIQMAALLLVFYEFEVEKERFFRLALVCFSGFVVHYFTPFRFKKLMFLAITLVGAFVVLNAQEGSAGHGIRRIVGPIFVLATGFGIGTLFYWCLRWSVPFFVRLIPILLVGALLAFVRTTTFLPVEPFWQILGTMFMFRMIVYAYDVKNAKKPESFMDFLNYFFLLPNFYFVLFPVVDYTTFKKSFYAEDIHATVQRGLAWIARGTIHLCLYRVIYHNVVITPDSVSSVPTLLLYIFQTFWLYLQVSGKFHIAIGMLLLFGYRLPETNHLYFLASSFTDFWRRINIYWKDFMVKVVYYPVYFRFRKMNEIAALTIATLSVFVVTTLLHSYQMFWIQGAFEIRSADLIFWGVLGVLVLFNVIWESKRKPKANRSRAASITMKVISTISVYVIISVLWSIWYSTSPSDWLDTVMYWR